MPWETFKRQRYAPSDQPLVTLQKKGIFSLNRAAYDALGSPKAVELLYDRNDRLIGLRKVSPVVPHAYKVRMFGKTGMSWLVSGAAFTNYYGIDVSRPVRRAARVEKDTLVLDLNDPGMIVSSTGGRPQKA
jgi:hypothetical protein